MVELEGFPSVGGGGDDPGAESETEIDTSKLVQEANRKKKKSGGFQSMGLSQEVWKGVIKKGYKVPTPIQRKTVPLIMDGKDVVAMARTGSGKTAAFLLPMFERLKARTAKSGARALVLSPTRELALQTLRFCKELGRFTGLTYSCVLGGDAMEKQFAEIHTNPDVIFATPGRFVHICMEMNLRLSSVEYVVFDEADRLFEMGLGDQLREILGRLPDTRQTVMFSATLPKMLVDFAKAGLSDPTLVRLDVESKIPESLKLAFLKSRADSKDAVLLHLLKNVISPTEQTIVFAATRYHVEYLQVLLSLAEIPATYIYSQLDPAARKINAAKFAARKVGVMVVTDLAARGIDIPLLDNVINYQFPAKSKLFVHRVGRVARAGREGIAYSLVAQDELAYYVDLQLFLGGEPGVISQNIKDTDRENWHRKLGIVPQSVLDEFTDTLADWLKEKVDLVHTKEQASNAYKQYLKSRPGASKESLKRCKEIKEMKIGAHPVLKTDSTDLEDERINFLEQMKNFKTKSTIFEIGNTSKNKDKIEVMNNKRKKHAAVIEQNIVKLEANLDRHKDDNEVRRTLSKAEKSTEEEIRSTFDTIVKEAKSKLGNPVKDKSLRHLKDESNFIPYQPADQHTEAGYSMMSGFSAQAHGAVLDLTGDDEEERRRKKGAIVWDKKSKKYVKVQDDKKRIKTESGVYISATYKTNRYAKWKERSKLSQQENGDDSDGEGDGQRGTKRTKNQISANHPAMKKARNAVPAHKKGPKFEIQRPEQILKKRNAEERKAANKAKGKGKKKGGFKSRR